MSYLHECHMQGHIFWVPAPWDRGEGPKCQISLNLNYKVNFKEFKNKLCVSSHKHHRQGFLLVPWVMPKGFGLGGAWGQKLNFLNMVMWHIKLKGMSSRPGYTENFTLQ